jgi:hypothetical protein
MSEARNLLLGDLKVGDELPALAYDVSASTVVLGALATRDWRPMHHDYDFAVNRNGVQNIFLNTPNQAAWFERWLTDWSGPKGRMGRIRFRMKTSVFPGDQMVFGGSVKEIETDAAGCGWVKVDVSLKVSDTVATGCEARIALPVDENDNPWARKGADWKP